MITVSDTARALIDSGRFVYHVRVSSWLNGELLAADVPIADGGEEYDRDLAVPERVQFTVPRRAHGVDWTPQYADDPLAAKGQTLKVSLGISQGADDIEWFQRGEFLIIETVPSSDTELQVTCAGLLTLVDEAAFTTPFQPASNFGATLRKLLEPAVLVDLTAAPQDRSITLATITWDTDRLGAVGLLLDAWPAESVMTEQGVLRVYPTTPPTVALKTFHDDAGGTVTSALPSSRRGDPSDTVIVTGYAATGAEVRATSYPASPPIQRRYPAGTANPADLVDRLPVPRRLTTALIDTLENANATARFLATREARRYKLKRLTVTSAPDPTLQGGDCVGVWADGVWTLGTVETVSLPYTPAPMTFEVVSTT